MLEYIIVFAILIIAAMAVIFYLYRSVRAFGPSGDALKCGCSSCGTEDAKYKRQQTRPADRTSTKSYDQMPVTPTSQN